MTKSHDKPRVRFAPSPTGLLHIGSARTALFNLLFARSEEGSFILRIEDTDKERSKPEYEKDIIEGLEWLGICSDEGLFLENGKIVSRGEFGPYRQSERISIYKKYLEKLLSDKKAYYCYCTKEEIDAERNAMLAQGLPPRYGGHCRDLVAPPKGKEAQVIRLKIPEAKVEFKDVIRGKVVFDANLFGDQILAKNLTTPLYNFAAVVDDEEMKITHVIRGEDHLSNTPKQILFQKALGFREITYAHLPLILNAERGKMSKRHAETSLLSYRDLGYIPEGIVNFLAFLGWHPQDNREVLSVDEIVSLFDLKRVQKAGAVFDQEKLEWLNAQHLSKLDSKEFLKRVEPFLAVEGIQPSPEFVHKIIISEQGRYHTLKDFVESSYFFFRLPSYDAGLLNWKDQSLSKTKEILEKTKDALGRISNEDFGREKALGALQGLIEKEGRGVVLWPLRVALSGQSASPDPILITDVLGKVETISRINIALKKIDAASI